MRRLRYQSGRFVWNDLTHFGLTPTRRFATCVKRLRCGECGSSSAMARQPNTEHDRRKRHA
jgi:hypothetical protein